VTGTTWRYTDGRTLTDGTYQYQVRVIDNAGNVGATDSQDVVIDLTKPAATTITVDSVSRIPACPAATLSPATTRSA
jgi:dihydrodipicolinate reductase